MIIYNAAVQKNDTFELLVAANKALTESLRMSQDEVKKLLDVITALSINGGGKPPGAAAETEAEREEAPPHGMHWDIVGPMDSRSRSGTTA